MKVSKINGFMENKRKLIPKKEEKTVLTGSLIKAEFLCFYFFKLSSIYFL